MKGRYLFQKDNFTYLYRPLVSGRFDVLRYKQYEYTTENVEKVTRGVQQVLNRRRHVSKQFHDKYPPRHLFWTDKFSGLCVPASFSFYYFFDTNRLRTMRGTDQEGEHHWWVEDVVDGRRYDLTSSQYTEEQRLHVYSKGSPTRLYSFKEIPQERMLDVMYRTQPEALRYRSSRVVNEVVSLETFMS